MPFAICDAVAYVLKLTVGLNKPLLLNIKKRFAEVVTVSQITSFETGGETSSNLIKHAIFTHDVDDVVVHHGHLVGAPTRRPCYACTTSSAHVAHSPIILPLSSY